MVLRSAITVMCLLPALLGSGSSQARETRMKEKQLAKHSAAWMAEGSYGMMVHYLITPIGNTQAARTADFNRTVDGFDLDYFMKQFEESGADWMIFTIGQNTGYYNSSNEVLDVALPGHTPKRDLVTEIARRVKRMNKRFIAYMAVEVAGQSDEVKQAFGWNPDDQSHYLKRYTSFIRAYSLKLGPLCDGWWFDGWFDGVARGKWEPRDWLAAAKAGNLKAIVALSDAGFLFGREQPVTPLQDYLGGEVHVLLKSKIVFDFVQTPDDLTTGEDGETLIRGREPRLYMPTSRFVDGVQWHALVPIDITFNPAISMERCRYSTEELRKFILECKKVGGAVTINVPIDAVGHIPEASAAQLKQIGKAVRKSPGLAFSEGR